MFHNKTIFTKSFNDLCKQLTKINYYQENVTYKRYALMHYNIGKYNLLKIWKVEQLHNYWYTDFIFPKKEDMLASIDYFVDSRKLVIESYYINNKKLSMDESNKLEKSLDKYFQNMI